MNKTLSTTLIVIAVLALAGGIFFAGSMYARTNAYGPSMMFGYGWNSDNYAYGPSMMNGNGGYGRGSGMMGGAGYNNRNGYSPSGMMGGNGGMMNMMGSGYGMMNGNGSYGMMSGYAWNNGTSSNVTPLTVDQAKTVAEQYIQSIDAQGLETGEVMIFDNNAYVVVEESETGLGAFELLIDLVSQTAYPEYGPNMMWNLKYGYLGHARMMGGRSSFGMMGDWNYQATPSTSVSSELTATAEQAVGYAQQYLDANYAGATAADDPTQFYGDYTLDFSKDGKIIGMLSVNGYNGQVFLHTWHGTFIEEAE